MSKLSQGDHVGLKSLFQNCDAYASEQQIKVCVPVSVSMRIPSKKDPYIDLYSA